MWRWNTKRTAMRRCRELRSPSLTCAASWRLSDRQHFSERLLSRTNDSIPTAVHAALRRGLIIPACPLALTAARKLDERRQRALFRYYLAAGAGGLAVGVHTTQFAIRDPKHGLFEPVLRL